MNPSATIIFLHIPKAAGSTLRQVIRRQYRSQTTLEFYGAKWFDQLEKFHEDDGGDIGRVNCVIGHFPFGIHRALPGRCRYFTMVREPIDWTLSLYYAMRSKAQIHPMMQPVRDREMSLQDFLEYLLEIGMANLQTRSLSGLMDQKQVFPPYGPLPADAIDLALANIAEYFDEVGLVDRFDESLFFMKETFGWKNIYVSRQNITSKRPKRIALSRDIIDKMSEIQGQDLALYRQITDQFERRLDNAGPEFSTKIKQYRLNNQLYRVVRKSLGLLLPRYR